MSCCFPKKLLSRRRREDCYKVDVDEEPAKSDEGNVEAEAPQFSWDKREPVNLHDYVVSEIHGDIHRRDGHQKDSMQIENCTEASIFLLKPTSSLNVDDCRDCLIVLGPCAGSVFIRDCSNCTILSACQQLRTRDCHDIKLGLLCPTQPIIENSDDMHFYPLAINYDDFKEQMKETSLSLFTNRVKSIHDFTPTTGKSNYKIHDSYLKLTNNQIDIMAKNNITTESCKSALPVFKFHNDISNTAHSNLFLYSIRDSDENLEDFLERGCQFADILKSSNVNLCSTYDIDATKLDKNLLPLECEYDNLMVFEVNENRAKLEKICDANYDLFKILDDRYTDQMMKLIDTLNIKRD